MVPYDRTRLPLRMAVYVALIAAWCGFARGVVAPLLAEEHPTRLVAVLRNYLHGFTTPFTGTDLAGRLAELSVALGIAAFLHLTILEILERYDRRAACGASAEDVHTARYINLALATLAAAFLAVAVLTWLRHDYYFYLQIWYEVRRGHDPWWIVAGRYGDGPLNAYGPLFNLLAGAAGLNPLAPRLLFAYAYLLFAIITIKQTTTGRPVSVIQVLGLFALFWNPFPWIEIAMRGHFDILVGLLCLAAVRARLRGRDVLAGVSLALGVLLKYFPIVLLPYLALDRGRLRLRMPVVAVSVIGLGLAVSCGVWGPATLRPLLFATNRPSTTMSIFWFIRSPYSPLLRFGAPINYDFLSPVFLFLALLLAWSWCRTRQPGVEASAAVVTATTVLLYRVGFPQYQMVPFVLASSWALRNWGQLRSRTLLGVAIGCQVAWLAVFDVCDTITDESAPGRMWELLQDVSGVPALLFGCLFLEGMVRASMPRDRAAPE